MKIRDLCSILFHFPTQHFVNEISLLFALFRLLDENYCSAFRYK